MKTVIAYRVTVFDPAFAKSNHHEADEVYSNCDECEYDDQERWYYSRPDSREAAEADFNECVARRLNLDTLAREEKTGCTINLSRFVFRFVSNEDGYEDDIDIRVRNQNLLDFSSVICENGILRWVDICGMENGDNIHGLTDFEIFPEWEKTYSEEKVYPPKKEEPDEPKDNTKQQALKDNPRFREYEAINRFMDESDSNGTREGGSTAIHRLVETEDPLEDIMRDFWKVYET